MWAEDNKDGECGKGVEEGRRRTGESSVQGAEKALQQCNDGSWNSWHDAPVQWEAVRWRNNSGVSCRSHKPPHSRPLHRPRPETQMNSDGVRHYFSGLCVSTMGMLFVAALLFRVWLAVAVGYGLGSASGQDPGPRTLHD